MWRPAAALLDLVLPRTCVGCATEGVWLCGHCAGLIREVTPLTCPFCDTPTVGGRTCAPHLSTALDGCFSFGHYRDQTLQRLIKRCKYGFAEDAGETLAARLALAVESHRTLFPANAVVLPMPLAARRERERGFNQSYLLARAVARALRAPLSVTILVRKKHRTPQAHLSDDERRTNVLDVFAVKNPEPILGQAVLLVDDVLTTGATLESAASALKSAGAREVYGIVAARG